MPRSQESPISRHVRHMRRARLSENYIRRRIGVMTSVAAVIGKPVEHATRKDLERWQDSQRVAPDSLLCMVTHVRGFYRWLADEMLRPDNPAERLERPRRTRRVPRPISEPDLTRALTEAPRRERLMLVLACQLGLRCVEIAGLRWESIVLDGYHPMLIVTWQTAKGRHERTLGLSPWIVAEFRRYGPQKAGWVIPRLDGSTGPNKPTRISRLIAEYLHSRGIAATAHGGRHRFATAILDNGGDLRTVQEALGHADLTNVQIYTLVRPAKVAAAIASLPTPEL